jgi:hypothetical protein
VIVGRNVIRSDLGRSSFPDFFKGIIEFCTRRSNMKVTIEIDCTPLEARQFMGLPDVQPMQAAAMAELEKRMLTELERVSPEGLLHSWFVEGPQNAEKLWKSLTNVMTGAIQPKPNEPKYK